MAHLRSIARQCGDCRREAAVELVNNRNARMGDYCDRHGRARLNKQQAAEDAEAAAAQAARAEPPAGEALSSDYNARFGGGQ